VRLSTMQTRLSFLNFLRRLRKVVYYFPWYSFVYYGYFTVSSSCEFYGFSSFWQTGSDFGSCSWGLLMIGTAAWCGRLWGLRTHAHWLWGWLWGYAFPSCHTHAHTFGGVY